MRAWPRTPAAVWFDLDGTLIDSAPDLHAAAVALCDEQGVAAPDYAVFRTRVSQGGRAMLDASFGAREAAEREALLQRFLEIYAQRIDGLTRPFEGVPALLDALDARDTPWGIVTNKSTALGEPLLRRLGLEARAAACVYGDTLPVRKPDPGPLLHACDQAGVRPDACIYVGDDQRDVEAAHAAGMPAVAAGWGYLGGADPASWGAERLADDVAELTGWLLP